MNETLALITTPLDASRLSEICSFFEDLYGNVYVSVTNAGYIEIFRTTENKPLSAGTE